MFSPSTPLLRYNTQREGDICCRAWSEVLQTFDYVGHSLGGETWRNTTFFPFGVQGTYSRVFVWLQKQSLGVQFSPPLININVSGGDSLNNGRDSSNTLFLPDCCVVLVRCSAVYTLYWFPSIRRGELRNDGARWMGLLCCSLWFILEMSSLSTHIDASQGCTMSGFSNMLTCNSQVSQINSPSFTFKMCVFKDCFDLMKQN